ncbi:MAG: hypothetical protein LBG92_12055 [Prevotellaceae bacterium]|nr:hypothetical protein [Prevotellaceae bacterium]
MYIILNTLSFSPKVLIFANRRRGDSRCLRQYERAELACGYEGSAFQAVFCPFRFCCL